MIEHCTIVDLPPVIERAEIPFHLCFYGNGLTVSSLDKCSGIGKIGSVILISFNSTKKIARIGVTCSACHRELKTTVSY